MPHGEPYPVASPESDVSPGSQPTARKSDYFGSEKNAPGAATQDADQTADNNVESQEQETPGEPATGAETSSASSSRRESLGNVTFRAPRNPSLPQGAKKPHGGSRIREASPPHHRFESHVAFDNVPLGESTDYNPISFTLNARHAGFQFNRRHRTFMVGVDDNSYSDHALQWLMDELVDDGDEIVCVRVIETQTRSTEQTYQADAEVLMDHIQRRNTKDLAISLVLEYAVGKLHNTFQHLIKIYQPSMLIVGTKGRSMEGVHGFLVNRSSFSKYCLQYSPVPVVVVRPTEKREKKKAKRNADPSRQSYVHMLAGAKHEADSENSSVYELEPTLTPDEEAHRVAVAVGLPAAYDPTLKPVDPKDLLRRGFRSSTSKSTPAKVVISTDKKLPEESESEVEEEEFEVTSGQDLLKKERLHKMESNEGAALRHEVSRSSNGSTDSDDEPPGGKT